MRLEDRIAEAVRDHLPESVSGELKEYLDRAAGNEKSLNSAVERIEELQAEVTTLEESEKHLRGTVAEYKSREKEVADLREQFDNFNAALREDRIRCEAAMEYAEKYADAVERIMDKVFSNNTYKYQRSVKGHVPVAVEGAPGLVVNDYVQTPPQSGYVSKEPIDTVEEVEGEGTAP